MKITEKKDCRVCGSDNLVPVLSLGEQFVTNFLSDPNTEALRAPLDLVLCNPIDGCGLLQLKHTVERDELYRQYWYLSGTSTTMVDALRDLAHESEEVVGLSRGDIVVDIGSNDGTLLKQYRTHGIDRVGFEPSNLWSLCKDSSIKTLNDYFGKKRFMQEMGNLKAKLITSVAMFYDLDNPHSFVKDIKDILSPDGLWVIQMNYLGTMIEQTTFDNVSHEHLEYYSLGSLEKLLSRHGFKVGDVETNDVNGGSFRTYIVPENSPIEFSGGDERVKAQREYERGLGLESLKTYEDFSDRTEQISKELHDFLGHEVGAGKKVYIIGASTRGLVVLQHAGIDNKIITAAADKNPNKFGRYIVGTGIPITSLESFRQERPDYALVLPYQFKDEIILQEADYLNEGGKMVFAIPRLTVTGKEALE